MDNFQAYGEFARVYDMFQDNVDYQTWGQWLKQQLAAQGITDGLVLDLGCGTGTMTEILAEAGYDMIGVDNSGEMLAEAMEKRVESGHDILYLLQDMQEFELYGTVRAVVSVCDSLNYITEEEELEHVFALVNNYLDPQGIFLFDMNRTNNWKWFFFIFRCTYNTDNCKHDAVPEGFNLPIKVCGKPSMLRLLTAGIVHDDGHYPQQACGKVA